jgi:SAM-dependent methyltransferase
MAIAGPAAPSEWVERFLPRAAPGGPALDLACGGGRHRALLLACGHPVVAVDRDVGAVQTLAHVPPPALEIVAADLEQGPAGWPLGARTFAVVVVVDYLWRPLLPRIVGAVASGGILLYETFARGHERYGRPRNPEFLLEPGELLAAVHGQLEVVAYEHGPVGEPPVMVRQRICALRPPVHA